MSSVQLGDSLDTTTSAGDAPDDGGAPVALPTRWRPIRRLGGGGQAEVWLAFDAVLDTRVAIKLFRPDLTPVQRERLKREVNLGRTLQHPGLVRIFEVIEAGDRLGAVMEWVPEGSLAQRLEAGPLAPADVVRAARDVLAVLAYLHGQSVVHRDVKPSNLLVDSEGRVRLADLGLARPLDDRSDLTRTLTTVGTPAFMSPEQIRGEEPAPAGDLYSLGVTLYQLLTGELPYSGHSEFEVADQHLRAAIPDPRRIDPEHPAWLARFVMRLLEKRPRDRFASAGEALLALEQRRVRRSGRVTARYLAAALALVVLAATLVGVRRLVRTHPATASVAGEQVTASDARGRVLWQRSFAERAPAAIVADVVGDSEAEVVVGLGSPGRDGARGGAEVLVLDGGGDELARIPVGRASFANAYPELTWSCAPPELAALDLDGDGRTELVWADVHASLFPCEIGGWNARAGREPGPILVHSGHLTGVTAADLDGDGRAEVLASGVNNPLGYQTVLAAVAPVPGRTRRGFEAVSSPDLTRLWVTAASRVAADRSVAIVTPLGPYRGWSAIASAGPGGIVVRTNEREIRLDAAGNPVGLAAVRQGLGAPLAVLGRPGARLPRSRGREHRGSELVAALRANHADVLAEAPMALAADLMVARSAARAGLHAEAIAVLEEGVRRDPEVPDLRLRLGEQLFVAGRRERAFAVLADAARPRPAGRNGREAMIALALGASLIADDAAVARVQETWARLGGVRPGIDAFQVEIRAVWAFQRGNFADADLRSPLRRRRHPGRPCPAALGRPRARRARSTPARVGGTRRATRRCATWQRCCRRGSPSAPAGPPRRARPPSAPRPRCASTAAPASRRSSGCRSPNACSPTCSRRAAMPLRRRRTPARPPASRPPAGSAAPEGRHPAPFVAGRCVACVRVRGAAGHRPAVEVPAGFHHGRPAGGRYEVRS